MLPRRSALRVLIVLLAALPLSLTVLTREKAAAESSTTHGRTVFTHASFHLTMMHMIRLLIIITLILAWTAASLMAQPGYVGVYGDPGATNIDIIDAAPGLLLAYVVHVVTPGATAAQFIVPQPWCLTATYLSEAVTAPYIKIGTCAGPGATGCAIAYGSCVASPNMILTIQYFSQGTTPNCCCLYVEGDPSATPPGIYVTDCSDPPLLLRAGGGSVWINWNYSCDECINDPVPVEETSWGKIKAMYFR